MLCWSSLVVIGCNGSHLPTVATWPGLILMCVDDLCLQESLTCLVWFSKARLGRGLPAKNVVFGV